MRERAARGELASMRRSTANPAPRGRREARLGEGGGCGESGVRSREAGEAVGRSAVGSRPVAGGVETRMLASALDSLAVCAALVASNDARSFDQPLIGSVGARSRRQGERL